MQRYRIAALIARALELAGEHIDAIDDARVTTTIDARLVRYYQALGIVSAPLGYVGRAAEYGEKHAHQIAVAKALQGQGLTLAQVKATIEGRDERALRAVLDDPQAQAISPFRSPTRAAPPPFDFPPQPSEKSEATAPRTTTEEHADEWSTTEVAPGVLLTLRGDAANGVPLVDVMRRALGVS